MIYGYARVSTKGQARDGNGLEAQEEQLKNAGATRIYADAFTGTKAHRPQLDILMGILVSGDTIVVTKLDRIARSASQGMELIAGKTIMHQRKAVRYKRKFKICQNEYLMDLFLILGRNK